jgi:hypothetical protein
MGTAPQAQVSTRGRRATVGCRPALGHRPADGDLWSPGHRRPTVGARSLPNDYAPTAGRRPQVGGLRPAGNQRSPAGRRSTPAPMGQFPFFLKFFFFLPSTFCASGQLLLVGSSTCPPCPNFSFKLQTPITFDP